MSKLLVLSSNEEEIVHLYTELGLPLEKIISELNLDCCRHTLSRYIKHLGIPTRSRQESLYRYRRVDISRILNIQEHSIAYVLGFIAADGNVISKLNRVTVNIKAKDEDILHNIKDILDIDNPIKNIKNKNQLYLSFRHPQIGDVLSKWEIVDNKSLTMRFPKHFPNKYLGSYLCGVFDGDGSITIRFPEDQIVPRADICFCSGSLSYIKGIQNVLQEEGMFSRYDFCSGCYRLYLSNNGDIKKFYNFLYSDVEEFSLARKRNRFLSYFNLIQNRKKEIEKLREGIVKRNLRIASLHRSGNYLQKELARKFSLSYSSISRIIKEHSYEKISC